MIDYDDANMDGLVGGLPPQLPSTGPDARTDQVAAESVVPLTSELITVRWGYTQQLNKMRTSIQSKLILTRRTKIKKIKSFEV